jgi:hypothetical protein
MRPEQWPCAGSLSEALRWSTVRIDTTSHFSNELA